MEFFKHSKNYVSVVFIVKIINILAIPYISRVLSTEEFGIVSLFASTLTTLAIYLV